LKPTGAAGERIERVGEERRRHDATVVRQRDGDVAGVGVGAGRPNV
jgi:hypothetical protein